MQQLVDVDLLEHGHHGHGVHGRDDGAEQQAGQQVHAAQLRSLQLTHGVHHPAHKEGVPQRAHHREHQDGAQVLREGPDGQEVAGIEDDGRQQVEEEELRVEDGGFLPDGFDEAADQQADHDQQAALWDHARHSGDNMKTCGVRALWIFTSPQKSRWRYIVGLWVQLKTIAQEGFEEVSLNLVQADSWTQGCTE